MSRFLSRSSLGALISCAALLHACIRHTAEEVRHGREQGSPIEAKVRVTTSERHQILEGFGASVAWHIEKLVGNPPAGIYDLLFPELGLDILRFRNRYQRTKATDGNLAQEVEILRRATQALGHPPKLLLSSWSPPAALKANREEDCHGNRDCTLKKEGGRFLYEEFAGYWYDSLRHYASIGIVPDWISIENEPSFIPPYWEGCKFEATETAEYPGYDRALAAVHEKVSTLTPRPKLLGPEVLGIHWGTLQSFIQAMNVDLVDGVAHHLYERGNDAIWDWRKPGPDSFVDEMRAAAALTTKPLFQTEFETNDDRGVEGGFETAWLIHHSLVEEGVVAFLYWNLIWDTRSGLVAMVGEPFTIRDQYYSLRHYAKFTDPGYTRVGAQSDAPSVLASAYVSPSGKQLTLVLLNTGKQSANVRIDIGSFPVARSSGFLTTYRPPASEVWKDLGELGTNAEREVSLPSRSLATIAFFSVSA